MFADAREFQELRSCKQGDGSCAIARKCDYCLYTFVFIFLSNSVSRVSHFLCNFWIALQMKSVIEHVFRFSYWESNPRLNASQLTKITPTQPWLFTHSNNIHIRQIWWLHCPRPRASITLTTLPSTSTILLVLPLFALISYIVCVLSFSNNHSSRCNWVQVCSKFSSHNT